MHRVPSIESEVRVAEEVKRRGFMTEISEHCDEFAAGQWQSFEKYLQVKATKDGQRIEAVLLMRDQVEVVGMEFAYTWVAKGLPASETYTLTVPRQNGDTATDTHDDIPTTVLEDIAFLSSDLETRQPFDLDEERREVNDISESLYRQLTVSR